MDKKTEIVLSCILDTEKDCILNLQSYKSCIFLFVCKNVCVKKTKSCKIYLSCKIKTVHKKLHNQGRVFSRKKILLNRHIAPKSGGRTNEN